MHAGGSSSCATYRGLLTLPCFLRPAPSPPTVARRPRYPGTTVVTIVATVPVVGWQALWLLATWSVVHAFLDDEEATVAPGGVICLLFLLVSNYW